MIKYLLLININIVDKYMLLIHNKYEMHINYWFKYVFDTSNYIVFL